MSYYDGYTYNCEKCNSLNFNIKVKQEAIKFICNVNTFHSYVYIDANADIKNENIEHIKCSYCEAPVPKEDWNKIINGTYGTYGNSKR